MLKGEVESETPEEVLANMRISSDLYEPLHKIFRPSWLKQVKVKQNFYEGTSIAQPNAYIDMQTGFLVIRNGYNNNNRNSQEEQEEMVY